VKKSNLLAVVWPAWMALGVIFFTACSNKSSFRSEKVIKGPFHTTVHSSGRLQSAASLFIGCPSVERMWEYTITFMAPEGKPVKRGEVILSFNDKELRERLQLKQAELDTAEKELERLELQENEIWDGLVLQQEEEKVKQQKVKHKTDVPEEFVAPLEMKKRKLDLELAELRLKMARSRISNQVSGMKSRLQVQRSKVKLLQTEIAKVQADIAKMSVLAPKEGMVVYALDWDGKKKAVGDTCWMGLNVLELPDLKKMQVKAAILEPQAGRLKTGQKTDVRLDANPDRAFFGTVTTLGRIFRIKSDDQPVTVFDVVIDLTESDPALMRPGMAATIDIDISSIKNVLQIPEAAIIYQEEGTFVRKKGLLKNTLVPVAIGARSKGIVQLLRGLKENDEVMVRADGKGDTR
jgi:HlyD family secretion protein